MTTAVPTPSMQDRLQEHARRLSGLQLKLLLGFLILGIIGLGGLAWSWTHPPTMTVTTTDAPAHANGFLGDAPAGTTTTTTADTSPTWTSWFSGHGARLGFGFVGGFIIGFIFRAFVKLMTLLTFVIGGGLAALSYFNILHVDLTSVHHAWTSNSQWMMTEATKLKDVLVAHLPSSTTGAAGIFVGMRRK